MWKKIVTSKKPHKIKIENIKISSKKIGPKKNAYTREPKTWKILKIDVFLCPIKNQNSETYDIFGVMFLE